MSRRVNPLDQLVAALKSEKTQEFKDILSKCDRGTALELCSQEIHHHGTLLNLAAKQGNNEAIKAMLALGLDVNKKQTDGHVVSGLAALHSAVIAGNRPAVEFLLQEGANVNIQESEGQTPLYCACMSKKPEVVSLLLNYGAKVNVPDYKGQTPLQISILRAPREITQILIQNGADVTIVDKDGQSPLHYASEWGDCDTVELLLSKGVNVNLQDNEGLSPLHVTTEEEVLDILIKNGGDVNLRNNRGKPPVETQIDTGKEEYQQINAALSLHVDLMAKKAARPSEPSPLAKDIQKKYNAIAMAGSAESGAAKVNMLAELQSRVKTVGLDDEEVPTKPKYKPSPLAGAGVLSELTSKTSKVPAEKEDDDLKKCS